MTVRKFFIFLLFTAVATHSFSQYTTEVKKENKLWDKIYFGGNFGLAIGSITQIDLSPIVGYHVSPRLSAGIGGTYQYYSEKIDYGVLTYSWNTSIYGPKLFSNFILIDGKNNFLPVNLGTIMLDAEFEFLNVDTYRMNPYTGFYEDAGRQWISNFLVGGGFRLPIGSRSSADIMILYNLTDSPFSPYSNPVIRFGFNL
ncbi:MAG: hypothetical protein NTW49_07085 [Bacteroidia bacterium]|nr:hypothetical protein [Bacteroidia bacterium]